MVTGGDARISVEEKRVFLGKKHGQKATYFMGGHGEQQGGKFLGLTKRKEQMQRMLYIREGPQAGGCWRRISSIFEVTERKS